MRDAHGSGIDVAVPEDGDRLATEPPPRRSSAGPAPVDVLSGRTCAFARLAAVQARLAAHDRSSEFADVDERIRIRAEERRILDGLPHVQIHGRAIGDFLVADGRAVAWLWRPERPREPEGSWWQHVRPEARRRLDGTLGGALSAVAWLDAAGWTLAHSRFGGADIWRQRYADMSGDLLLAHHLSRRVDCRGDHFLVGPDGQPIAFQGWDPYAQTMRRRPSARSK